MKIAAAVEYCGTGFHGWQRLKDARSVQQTVEEALSTVADHRVNVVCAGRTDSGVHARYQVIHFETSATRDMHSWVFGANANLPADVSLLWAMPIADEFHARFSARARTYEYLILNRPARSGLYGDFLCWERRSLDAKLMRDAAAYLVGKHDFSSFRAQGCQASSPVREIYEMNVERYGPCLVIRVRANAFLYHMVRNISGVLLAIGSGMERPGWAGDVLQAKDRRVAGVTAPPQGLYLTSIEYPDSFAVPAPSETGLESRLFRP